MVLKLIPHWQPIQQFQQQPKLLTRWLRIGLTNQFKNAGPNRWQRPRKLHQLTVIGMCQSQKN